VVLDQSRALEEREAVVDRFGARNEPRRHARPVVGDDGAPRLPEPLWPEPIVPVQPADALQQEVDRREVGHQQIEVDVQRLLRHLRRDHHVSIRARPLAGGPERTRQPGVVSRPIRGEVPRVVEAHLARCKDTNELVERVLSALHGVADDERTTAATQRVKEERR